MHTAESQLRQAEELRQSGRYDEAIACLESLLHVNPNLAAVHNNLGLVWIGKQDFTRAVACFREAIRIRRDFAEAYCNLGTILLLHGDHSGDEAAIREAIRIKPDFAHAHVCYAAMLLGRGDFEQGWQEFEWRRIGQGRPAAPTGATLWDGRDAADASILLLAEHGIGDTIQFIRYAALVKQRCKTVVVQCEKPLLPLLGTCPGIDQLVPRGEEIPRCDFQTPLLSLPLLFGTTLATIPTGVPYVCAHPKLVDSWRERLASYSGFKVGISWQGNPRYPTDGHRSIPLRHFRSLAAVPSVTLFSLQKSIGTDQLAGCGKDFSVVDFGPDFDTSAGAFMDTAAVMQNLDLVITSDTAVAHLAGALGIPVWVALCKAADWRWLEQREDSPWYPTMRLFRQVELGDWATLFQRIVAELKLVVEGDRSRLLPQCTMPLDIQAPMGAGELLDRILILEIRCQRAVQEEHRQSARYELDRLVAERDRTIRPSPELDLLVTELHALNGQLWDAEDRIRVCERQQDFGPDFIELARTIYLSNDGRSDIKRKINILLTSRIGDVKDYGSNPGGSILPRSSTSAM